MSSGAEVRRREGPDSRLTLPSLYLISDVQRVGAKRFIDATRAAIAAGLRMLQLREPGWPAARLRELMERLRPDLPDDFRVIINCRPGASFEDRRVLARELDLDGMHLGGCGVEAISTPRERLGERVLLGYSAHAVDEVARAFHLGVDYVSFSPVYAPLSKPRTVRPHGVEGLRRACECSAGPVYALGGIDAERARQVRQAGAAGVAVIGAILDAAEPDAATRALLA